MASMSSGIPLYEAAIIAQISSLREQIFSSSARSKSKFSSLIIAYFDIKTAAGQPEEREGKYRRYHYGTLRR